MPNVTALVDDLSSKIRTNISKGEETTLKTVESWTETVEGMLPESITSFEAVERLPKPTQLVEFSFDIADKVVDLQVEVLKSIAGVIDPVLAKVNGNGTTTAKTSSTKSTASKSRTTKAAAK